MNVTDKLRDLYHKLMNAPHLFSARHNNDHETMARYLNEHHPGDAPYTKEHVGQILATPPEPVVPPATPKE